MENLSGMNRSAHRINLTEREQLSVTGVEDVISFDEKQVILDTNLGKLLIKGERLHVKKLSLEKGEVELEGDVDQLTYSASGRRKSEESFLSRLLG